MFNWKSRVRQRMSSRLLQTGGSPGRRGGAVMKRYLFVLAAAIVIAGCEKAPETSPRAGSDFTVDKLFTVDSCTVYRFTDGGRPRYFTNCKGTTEWNESCGKNCTNSVGIDGGRK